MKFPTLRALFLLAILGLSGLGSVFAGAEERSGNVVFLHPDGAGLQGWAACRMLKAGPDGEIAWDRIPEFGLYRGHMEDGLTATSHGGATSHAFGVKVPADSYGMAGTEALTALSGFDGSLMREAMAAGKAVGIVNSGHVGEPGTGCFLASVPTRKAVTAIAEQVVLSGAEVIFCGGEVMMLPKGKRGVHGENGIREDGRDLIQEARDAGYTVIFTREDLLALETDTAGKVLGVFAAEDTYNDLSEIELRAAGLPLYQPGSPTVAEMVKVALALLNRHEEGFLLVAEEEGSDNFANQNNAAGTLEALMRADAAIEAGLSFVEANPDTLLVTAADTDAGGLQVVAPCESTGMAFEADRKLPPWMPNGAPLDGVDGAGSTPFESAPDANGRRFHFGISWAGYTDVHGGVVARAAGLNAGTLGATVDNTDIYRIMYRTLFGKEAD